MLWNWFRRPKQRRDWTIVLYTRQGCCLCEEAWRKLVAYQARHGFALEAVDIDAVPEWKEQYDTCVPVIAINGKVRFRGRMNPVLFERLIAAR